MVKTAKRPSGKGTPGRPPADGEEAMGVALTIRLPTAMNERIEAICRRRMDRPAKGQIVRELLAKALESEK